MKRAIAALCIALAGCGAERDPVEVAWRRGVAFLVARQRPDGSIGSDHYGVLRAGRSTTAVGAYAICRAPAELRAAHAAAVARALAFLSAQVDDRGAVVGDGSAVDYPNYTAAFLLLTLEAARPDGFEDVRARVVERLRAVQLAGRRAVAAWDLAYGGFDLGVSADPLAVGEVPGVDLSTTSWVLEGLRAAGVSADDPTVRAAGVFVERCQPWPGDGGFVFSPSSEHRPAKAGDGVVYGTPTADGLRALLLCGLAADHERVRAAGSWLRQRLAVARVPGFAPEHAALEEGLRIYWLCALTRALGSIDAVQDHVVALQRRDGSFVGPSALMKEDDPLVATPLALLALGGIDGGSR